MKAIFGGGGAKYGIPPFPHPLPERSLSLYCTSDGLFIVPNRPAPGGEQTKATTSAPAIRRHHHSPRTSISSTTEDVATDVLMSRRNSIPRMEGAKIGWGRQGKVKPASDAELKRVMEEAGSTAAGKDDEGKSMQCYGVLGIQRLFNDAYLLAITSRTFAGDFCDSSRPVYKCTGVLVIPLSYERAKSVLAAESSRQRTALLALEKKEQADKRKKGSTAESEDDDGSGTDGDVVTPSVISRDSFLDGNDRAQASTAAADAAAAATVKAKKSGPWLSARLTRRASSDAHEFGGPQGSEPTDDPSSLLKKTDIVNAVLPAQQEDLTPEQRWHEATKAELEDKVVKETARQYSRGEMFWSYDFDLTTPLQRKQDSLDSSSKGKAKSGSGGSVPLTLSRNTSLAEPSPTLPLWRRADRRFWHNEYISKDFIEAGLHGLVLPLMQGYFQVTSLPLDSDASSPSEDGDPMDAVSQAASSLRTEAQLLIISRRSKERAGLRYQRRGVNELGQVANYVETEQILYVKRGDNNEQHYLSFLQFRGSIPQFWKQDPFSMKPPPVLERSAAENKAACSKHFEAQLTHYGKVICINLAEQHGKEGAITKAYKDAVEGLASERVLYKGFDFHEECKGMKFENIKKLIDELKDDEIKRMDCFWKRTGGVHGEVVASRQTSAFRVSCLDCLDRTNVVQSAFGRHMLGVQLQRLGVHRDSNVHDEEFDFAFNDSWANNGDMVSQIYAGTRALKGDFTRTGKRNLMGMVNDATNSVYRMVQGAVTDFFKQTVIDFQYGQTSLSTLERYNDKLAAQDPSESHRLARVRANAVETCAKEILASEEEGIAGWTLFSPIQANRIVSTKLEEKVLLLTNKSIYVCGYDFTTEMLVEYAKIRLGDIVGIQRGVYILSPNEGYHPENHWGLSIEYLSEERRLNTASMKNVPPTEAMPSSTNFVAFRAVVDDAESPASLLGSAITTAASPSSAAAKWNVLFTKNPSSDGKRTTTADHGVPHTSHALVDHIVETVYTQCCAAGACDSPEGFIREETIQSLAQAKANAPLFAPLIEGLKRRLWL